MKIIFVLVLSALAVAVQSNITKEEAMEVLRPISKSCMEETGTKDADFEAMLKHEPAGSMAAKCLRACILKKLELMNKDGRFVKDTAMKIAGIRADGDAALLKISEQIVDACTNAAFSENHCEAAEQYGLCMQDEAKKHGISIHD